MGRFQWLTQEAAPRTLPWDVDLTPSLPFATVPSRGALVPGWVLVLPRRPAISIAALSSDERAALLEQASAVASRIKVGPAMRATYFEHGPTRPGTATGCGVDHAHLHVVPLGFDLLAALPAGMGWRPSSGVDPWAGLGLADYLLVGDGERWLACEPSEPRSQFFRHLIAAQVGHDGQWDHNLHLGEENVRRTVDTFQRA